MSIELRPRDAINKKKGLSPKHVLLSLDEMAKYHALGHAWLKSYHGGTEQGCNSIDIFVPESVPEPVLSHV